MVVAGMFAYFTFQNQDSPITVEGPITNLNNDCWGVEGGICYITVDSKKIITECNDMMFYICPEKTASSLNVLREFDFAEGDKVRATVEKNDERNEDDEFYNVWCKTCSITKIL